MPRATLLPSLSLLALLVPIACATNEPSRTKGDDAAGGSGGGSATGGAAGAGGASGAGGMGGAGGAGGSGGCPSGWADCDGDPANGCEASIAASSKHCGDCTTKCSTVHGSATCVNGTCQIDCHKGYLDCDKVNANGCEADVFGDPAHCGDCDTSCPSGVNQVPTCTAGVCGVACQPGFADCDGEGTSCEIQIAVDPENCGACGQACTGACSAGACTGTVLASGLNFPSGVAVDATHLYWVEAGTGFSDGTVKKMPLAGGAATVLASGQPGPMGIALDDAHVYWTNLGTLGQSFNDSSIRKVPKAGGAEVILADGQKNARMLVVDAGVVYWTHAGTQWDFPDGEVRSVPSDGGAITTLATAQKALFALLASGGELFWAGMGTAGSGFSDSSVIRFTLPAGPSDTLVTGWKGLNGLARHGADTFATAYYDNVVLKIPDGGGAPEVLADGVESPGLLATDGANVYWTNRAMSGGVMVCAVAGCANKPKLVASMQTIPFGIALSATDVYWTVRSNLVGTGKVMVSPK